MGIAGGIEQLHIRIGVSNDIPLILALIKELAEYERMSDEVHATEELLQEWLFDKNIAQVLIAEWNDEPIGFALYFHNFSTFVGRGGVYLEDLYVRPAFRGKGVGKALFKRLAKTCVQQRCGRMEWMCLDWNEPSIRFYRSLNATSLDDWTVYRLNGDALLQLADADAADDTIK